MNETEQTNKINILDIKNEVLYIKTEEYAFNHWFITKKEYGSDYLLYDNLYWHGIGETDNY